MARSKGNGGADQVQAAMDEEQERGYRGTVADPTPNENYSLQTPQDAPVPETDRAAKDAVREHQRAQQDALEVQPQPVKGAVDTDKG
jgi:hypothetical protein